MIDLDRSRSGAVDSVGNTTSATVDFRGNTITALDVTNGGARRILATFDTDFAGCTAQVTCGKKKGAATIINHSIVKPGVISEIASVQISGVRCVVKNGNVFGRRAPLRP